MVAREASLTAMGSDNDLVNRLFDGLGNIECDVPGLARILAALVKHAPLALWIYNAQGQVVYNNLASCEWGSGRNILGEGLEQFSPAVRDLLKQGLEECLSTGKPIVHESWVDSNVFGRCYMKFDFLPLPGGLVGCSHSNLTESKRVEKALQESEERVRIFAWILEQALVPFGAATPDGMLTMANQAFCQLTGYSEQSLRRISFFEELTATESADKENSALRMLAQTGQPRRYEKRMLRADGAAVPVEVFVQQIADSQGICQSIFFFVTDITERQQAQEALRLSEERLALALEGAADGIWDYSPQSGEVFRSTRITEQLGYAPEELASTLEAWFAIVHPDDRQRVIQAWEAHLDGLTGQYSSEHRLRTKSGEYLWVLDSGKVVQRDTAGNPLRVAGTHKNISERKRIQEQLVREQKEQTLTSLAGGIAHDFNNILVGILGAASLLRDMVAEDSQAAEYCTTIASSAQRMGELTGKLLAYARGGAFQPRPVDAAAVAGEALGMVHTSIPPQIELVKEWPEDLWPVLADPGQLLQVLLNLLVNASEALGRQPGRITLSAENCAFDGAWLDVLGQEQLAGEYVRLSVADTGDGMDEKDIRAAFEPFYSTKSIGRGLGLAAVSGIISQHQGAIRVDCKPGAGSTFSVFLPRATCAPLAAQPERTHAERGRETILVVDDDDIVLQVLQAMLRRAGYQVLAATSAQQGVALFRANLDNVALAILDVHLEHENGHDLLAHLRDLRPGLPAIISSGFSEELTLAETYQDGRTSFMQKPYDSAELAHSVREMLDRCAGAF